MARCAVHALQGLGSEKTVHISHNHLSMMTYRPTMNELPSQSVSPQHS